MHATVHTPVPSTVTPPAGYTYGVPLLVEQLVPDTPEGPADADATTVTAWLTHTLLGSASFGVDSAKLTGVLSIKMVSAGADATPAALLAW